MAVLAIHDWYQWSSYLVSWSHQYAENHIGIHWRVSLYDNIYHKAIMIVIIRPRLVSLYGDLPQSPLNPMHGWIIAPTKYGCD